MDIYWDYANRLFLESPSTQVQFERWDRVQRDLWYVNLYLVTRDADSGAYTIGAAPAGFAPKFEIKASGAFAGDPLVQQLIWTASGSGTSTVYSASIPLNTAELNAVLNASTDDYVTLTAEFTLQDVSLDNRDSTQVDVRIYPDVIRPNVNSPSVGAGDLYPRIQDAYDAGTGAWGLEFFNKLGESLGTMFPPGV